MIRCLYRDDPTPSVAFYANDRPTVEWCLPWTWERGATDRTTRVPCAVQRLAFLPDLWRVCP